MADLPDPVRARAHQLLDELLDLVRPAVAPSEPETVLPLATAADRLGWSRRRLRAWCLDRGVTITGRGKHAAVDLAAVRAALAGQPALVHHRPVLGEFESDLRDALGGR